MSDRPAATKPPVGLRLRLLGWRVEQWVCATWGCRSRYYAVWPCRVVCFFIPPIVAASSERNDDDE